MDEILPDVYIPTEKDYAQIIQISDSNSMIPRIKVPTTKDYSRSVQLKNVGKKYNLVPYLSKEVYGTFFFVGSEWLQDRKKNDDFIKIWEKILNSSKWKRIAVIQNLVMCFCNYYLAN